VKRSALLSSVFLLTFGTVACGSRGKEDRQKVLEADTYAVILPSLAALQSRTQELGMALTEYCENPSPERLTTAQQSWLLARETYKLTAAFQVGPLEDFVTQVDFWPVRELEVENAVRSAPANSDRTYLDTLGVAARGFAPLEYLLFGAPAELSVDPNALRRCSYAKALAADIAERALFAYDAWTLGGFAQELAQANASGSQITSTQAGVDLLLNATTAALVDLTDKALARPLGEKSGGVIQPLDCESRYSGTSSQDYLAALHSVRRLWIGALEGEQGRGLTLLVRRHNIPADERVRSALDEIAAFVERLDGDICGAIVTDAPAVARALEAARRLRQLVTTEVVQVMGGTLTFSDNDGD